MTGGWRTTRRPVCRARRGGTLAGRLLALAAMVALARPTPTPAQEITLVPFAPGFVEPSHVANAGDGSGRLFVSEFNGTVRIVLADGTVLPTPFLDLPAEFVGLHSVAFHPDYASNGRFFVYTTRQIGPSEFESVLSERAVDGSDPNLASSHERTILARNSASLFVVGLIAFGPDGYFYFGMGDREVPAFGQDLSTLFGSICRIDVNGAEPYEIPPDNPFAADGNPATSDEIFAYGFRNPWRFAWDAPAGRLFVSDVGSSGPTEREEISLIALGDNAGWAIVEGDNCTPEFPGCDLGAFTPPVAVYGPGATAVIGGFFYDGTRWPNLQGAYVFGDFVTGIVYTLREGPPDVWTLREEIDSDVAISSFGVAEDGEIYCVDYFTGDLLHVTGLAPASGTVVR